jgi:tryptophan synthase alpha chain
MSDGWTDALRAMADAGADAVEVGIPFSDPVMDGPTIQETSSLALARGATPAGVLTELKTVDAGVPLVAMTYYNLVFHPGEARFARWLADAGVAGAIVPDVPLEEAGPWCAAADAEGVETVLLAAPTASDERLARICDRSRGFVYGVSLLGVTGERRSLSETATSIAKRLKATTDLPVIIGIGISTPEQAVEVCEAGADGVVVASAIMRRLLDGEPPEAAGDAVAKLRAALDRG